MRLKRPTFSPKRNAEWQRFIKWQQFMTQWPETEAWTITLSRYRRLAQG